MNEILFFSHILIVLAFLGLAVRQGLGALTVFVALSSVLANLFVVKQMTLFGLQVTCSDVFAVGGLLGLNLISEFYGKENARRAVLASFIGLILFVVMSQIHLFYVPSPFDQTHDAFVRILRPAPRIVAASVAVFFLVQQIDIFIFARLRRWGGPLGVRLMLALFISQGIDTILFSFFGLYGLVASIFDVILVSWIVECAIIACSSPIAAFFQRFSVKEAA